MKLEIRNLTGGYSSGHDILYGVNMDVEQGQAIGIIGLNGSGKSTLAKAIMNILPYRNGNIIFNNQDISTNSTKQLSDKGVALFLQGGRIFDELSVWDNLHLIENGKWTMNNVIDSFPFLKKAKSELKKLNADKLSGGQRHQLALAMCLIKNPKILILDEPSAGLSPTAVNELYDTLETLRQKKDMLIILIEQNISRAVGFCDSVNMLQNGVISYSTDNKDIKEIEKIMFNKLST